LGDTFCLEAPLHLGVAPDISFELGGYRFVGKWGLGIPSLFLVGWFQQCNYIGHYYFGDGCIFLFQ
jgi:hypothetical protein